MNILLPVACYHEYNTAVYVESALRDLGHDARVITQAEYYEDHPDVDLFFCVDSAGPLNFPEKHRAKSVMWFIDSRHNNNPKRRNPDDDTNARTLADGGGWVFQAQKMDWERNVDSGLNRVTWLPLAADPDVWRPYDLPKEHDVVFGGNVWDGVRQNMLERIGSKYNLLSLTGPPDLLARGYSKGRIGFNISSFFGSEVAYDVNMRVFEVMSCGVPLVTNSLPDLLELGIVPEHHVLVYEDQDAAMSQVRLALQRGGGYRQEMGQRARQLIIDAHTYRHRVEEALEVLAIAGVIGENNE